MLLLVINVYLVNNTSRNLLIKEVFINILKPGFNDIINMMKIHAGALFLSEDSARAGLALRPC